MPALSFPQHPRPFPVLPAPNGPNSPAFRVMLQNATHGYIRATVFHLLAPIDPSMSAASSLHVPSASLRRSRLSTQRTGALWGHLGRIRRKSPPCLICGTLNSLMTLRGDATSAASGAGTMAVSPVAVTYQPKRLRGAILSVGWNLAWLALFIHAGMADRQPPWLSFTMAEPTRWPLYIIAVYLLYAIVNFPIELWYGYLNERQFGLVKQGLRAWARDWAIGACQHGLMFIIGSCLLVWLQMRSGSGWLFYAAPVVLVIFLASTYFAFDLIPAGLFGFQAADESLVLRLRRLTRSIPHPLPPVVVFTHDELRDFSGGLAGLGRREVLLISRPTVELGSDSLLRFVVLHEMGHRRFCHLLIGALIAWAWIVAGLVIGDAILRHWAPFTIGLPTYVPRLAMVITCWMIASHPLLAYVGRRLEYQADRFYLRHGGSLEEMQAALEELSRRNLARTDLTTPYQSVVQAMPTPARRLRAAEKYLRRLHH